MKVQRKERMPYSPDDDQALMEAWHRGASIAEISRLIDHPSGSIAKRMIILRGRGVDLPSRLSGRPRLYIDRQIDYSRITDNGERLGFTDEPRAAGDHGSSAAMMGRTLSSSLHGCSAAWAALG